MRSGAPGASAAPSTAPDDPTSVAARSETKTPEKSAEHAKPKTSEVADSGKTYVVVKGDNPVTIARHLHVSYDALLELNQIDDPRKMQKRRMPEHGPATAKHKTD